MPIMRWAYWIFICDADLKRCCQWRFFVCSQKFYCVKSRRRFEGIILVKSYEIENDVPIWIDCVYQNNRCFILTHNSYSSHKVRQSIIKVAKSEAVSIQNCALDHIRSREVTRLSYHRTISDTQKRKRQHQEHVKPLSAEIPGLHLLWSLRTDNIAQQTMTMPLTIRQFH